MSVSEKTKSEVLRVYDTWLHSYLHGDVTTYDSYFDDVYHFIGSTGNEEYLNRKDTTHFFAETAAQLAGKCDLRNESRTLEQFGDLVFITHVFDAWFLNDSDYTYYGRFRFTNVLRENNDGWRFVYQHFSTPDSKTEVGETIGFDKVNEENQQLREAIKRRTTELELKNRELQIESAVDRIRAEAVDMKQSSDLLDIVVTMRNEFIKLGHEAHYFWHMMWLPETYEKAMTSGDGSKIGFVMELPRHIHGDIPVLAKWEKSKKQTVVYTMDVEAAIDYVDKMVALGDFKNIDPQAPTHEDIQNIGGLTFIMARTTHGEIGYSLPGMVQDPPREDIAILVKFAGAFDLAHRRFLDLQKAERQAKETSIELSLERIRSRVTAMQKSSDLFEIVVTMRNEFILLGHEADYFWHMKWLPDAYEMSMTAEDGGRLGMVISVPKFVHDNIPSLAKWEKSTAPTFVLALDANEAWDYIDNMNTHGHYQLADPNAPTQEDIQHIGGITFIIARTTHGEIGFSLAGKVTDPPKASIDLLVRFANVFDLAYKRFEDLQKAEQQARETQIELALEKVRSRTMAMQRSDEIGAVALILFEQLESLGGELWGTGFAFCNKDSDTDEFWFVNNNGILPQLKIPNNVDTVHKQMYQGWNENRGLFSIAQEGKELEAHYDYMLTVPDVAPIFQEMLNNGINFPTWQRWYAAYFSQGYLLAITTAPYDHEEVFKRFAKVFEQAYTRFLDLQKTEAQAKEAKIETALEKVRSRSLAMQNSEELKELIGTVYNELNNLDMALDRCLIWIMNDADYSTRLWMANREAEPVSFYVPNHKNPPYRAVIKGWKERNTNWEYHLKGKVKKEWDQFVFEKTEMKHFPAKLKKMMQASEHTVMCASFHSFGCLQTAGATALTDEQSGILTRFAKVFNQAYTRFSDLQKAEAQAREAQIEASLERLRAASMAMHKTEDISEVVIVYFEQLKLLDIEFIQSWITIFNLDEDNVDVWFSPLEGIHNTSQNFQMPNALFEDTSIKSWKEGLPFSNISFLSKDEVDQFMQVCDEVTDSNYFGKIQKKLKLERIEILDANHKYGCISKSNSVEATTEEKDILQRFAKVFEQTYTRFLDLKKAETQAREAQIEVAVERVRAEAMAMHATSDFEKVTQQLLKQVQNLALDGFTGASILRIRENDVFSWWDFSSPGNIADPKSQEIIYNAHDFDIMGKEVLAKWKEGDRYMVFEYDLDRLKIAVREWQQINPQLANEFKKAIASGKLTHQWNPSGRLFNGLLAFDMVKPPDDDVKNITIKMAHAFEQAYIRFLDLQKAEGQAREAQIEAALERVRSRSLAMHKTDELQEVVQVVAEELKNTGVILDTGGAVICTYFQDSKDVIHWTAADDPAHPSVPFYLPYFEDELFDEAWASKNRGDTYFAKEFSFEVKNAFFSHAFEHSDYRQLPDDYKKIILGSETHGIAWAWSKNSAIMIPNIQGNLPSEEEREILIRFAKVFEQAFIRFKDLEKAEAQAREAKIEAALERVRSRSMAMHTSEELREVVQVVYEQFVQLDIHIEHAGFIMDYQENDDMHIWLADQNAVFPQITLPYFDCAHWNSFIEAKKTGGGLFTNQLDFEEKNKFYEDLFQFIPELPEETKAHYFECSALAISTVLLDTVGLYIENYDGIPFTEEENSILMRFGKVFQQTYTRFKDLQKAEQQARAAQINLAVERVRAKALAMHKSVEIMGVVAKLKQEVMALDIPNVIAATIFLNDGEDKVRMWDLSTLEQNNEGYQIPFDITFTLKKKDPHLYIKRVWENTEEYFIEKQQQKDFKRILVWLHENDQAKVAADVKEFIESTQLECLYHAVKKLNNGKLVIDLLDPPTAEMEPILTKMGAAFDLAYKRFEDLQNAERQAKEAQIETALEKVRSRTMAMQHSEELPEAANVLFSEVQRLGIPAWSCGYNILSEDKTYSTCIMSSEGEIQSPFILPLTKHKSLRPWHNAIVNNENFFVYEQGGRELEDHYAYMQSLPDLKATFQQLKDADIPLPTFQVNHLAKFTNGFLLFITYERVPEAHDIFKRFGKVFEQTYTRFLDLQKAEAQARESQIELGLERLRARAMAMQHSDELSDLVATLLHELTVLDFSLSFCIINIYNEPDQSNTVWAANPDEGKAPQSYYMKFEDYPFHHAMMREWKAQTPKFVYVMEGEEKEIYDDYLYVDTEFSRFPKEIQDFNRALDKYVASFVFSPFGGLQTVGDRPLSEESLDILYRFGKVFNQTYTRFIDLQKAEEQSREARIEAALERVRSQSMGMQSSHDLSKVTTEMFNQLRQFGGDLFATGIVFCDKHQGHVEQWHSIPNAGMMSPFIVPIDLDYIHQYRYDEWKKGTELFSIEIPSDFIEQHFNDIFNLPSAQKVLKDLQDQNTPMPSAPPWEIDYGASFKHGYLLVSSLQHFEDAAILPRFASVFEQTYTRFLDLQKVEAQAREAQIEAALERTRTQSMLMQHSNELDTTSKVFHEQLLLLGIESEFSYVWLPDIENEKHKFWAAWTEGKKKSGGVNSQSFTYELDRSEPYTAACFEAWESGEPVHIVPIPPEEVKNFFSIWSELLSGAENLRAKNFPEGLYYAEAYMKYGCFGINIRRSLTEAEQDILKRFTVEFERTYTRFLDLQKAEAQAREAQIEASLEKVRNVALSLKKSDDLLDIVKELYVQLLDLGFTDIRNAIIDVNNEDAATFMDYDYSHEMGGTITKMSYEDDPTLEEQLRVIAKTTDGYSEMVLEGQQLQDLIEMRRNNGEADDPRLAKTDSVSYILYAFGNGAVGISNFGVLSDQQKSILHRFRNVFTFAYQRYTDLAQAEAQLRESQIEAALEKVRSRSLSMDSSDQMQEVANELFKQMQLLGIEMDAVGMSGVMDATKDYQVWVGGSTFKKPITIPFSKATKVQRDYNIINTARDELFTRTYKGKVKKEYIDFLLAHNTFPSKLKMKMTNSAAFSTSISYSKNSGVQILRYSAEPYSDEENQILIRFAKVFEQAYVRFTDIETKEKQAREIEMEKQRLEKTLSDLQATQKQLIQSEKMASLGELTAGIAHEIQNPLNFVNNFSEVSNELIDEIDEELANGDLEEVKLLLTDIRQNLEKINHHGNRADAIVKGMLQHSRSTTTEKAPTDINKLTDEYLRLAYHGLRAKDKSFNATLETDFDKEVGLVDVMAQDMGRVILNLITNAFYAINEKKHALNGSQYTPTVSVSTKKQKDSIHIAVQDNGNGIPKHVIDKIFQPFFTTKPTGQGTGLGLSMSYDIVTKGHGGALQVETNAGEGTTFIISIPTKK